MTISFADHIVTVTPVGIVVLAIFIAPVAVSVIAIVRIIQRAGFSGWWILLVLVPVVNMLALWYFAFASWPALAKKPN
jgi:uncharacterized membrane protein YhaH (DUF805 family)